MTRSIIENIQVKYFFITVASKKYSFYDSQENKIIIRLILVSYVQKNKI